MWSSDDRQFMARAIQLAEKGIYSTHPNPRVGCVLVRNDEIVGEGFHERAGFAHAEVNAISKAGEKAAGATAYVTLEPCSHHGKTPPCADALINAGVSRVVVAMLDPNPLVSGRGVEKLRAKGIDVSSGLLREQAEQLNPGFIHRMTLGRSFVRVKIGMSLDARTAMASGESQWITSPQAREDVQRLRARSCAIVTGLGTVEHDDPKLTVRTESLLAARKNQPVRVVLDKGAQATGSEKVFNSDAKVIYVCADDKEPLAEIASAAHVELLKLALDADGRFDLKSLLGMLAEREVNEVLVESGSSLAGSFIKQGCCDELITYIAPKLMGSIARPMLNLELSKMSEAIELECKDVRHIGSDLRLTYRLGAES